MIREPHNRPSEPPFDGKPCPMCPSVVRNFSACVHNFLSCWQGHQWERVARKFRQMREAADALAPQIDAATHPDIKALAHEVDLLLARVAIGDLFTLAHQPAVDAVQRAYVPMQAMSDAHFADRQHAHGGELLQ